jgi:diguanylate cyclase (GGDEF)-like protein/PAS domain S-box-containing protein
MKQAGDRCAEAEADMSTRDQQIVSSAFDQAADPMMITDAAEKVVRINRQFTNLTGYDPIEIIGQSPAILRSGKNPPQLFSELWASVNASGRWQGEIWDRKKNGRLFVADLTISSIVNHYNKVTHYLGIYRDITLAKEGEMRAQMQETREPQTFLLNRAAFCQNLAELYARQGAPAKQPVQAALLLINLDDFREINDLYGIDNGDRILQETARRLRRGLRDSDFIGRMNGDEFAVLLSDLATAADVEKVTSKLWARLSKPYELGPQRDVKVSCSIGLTFLSSQNGSVDMALKSANLALGEAKEQGGNCWRVAGIGRTTDGDAYNSAV